MLYNSHLDKHSNILDYKNRIMDPKNLNTLDPKLKEVYERVMGTSIPLNSSPQTSTKQSPPSSSSFSPPGQAAMPSPTPSIDNTKTPPPPPPHIPEKPVIDYAAISAKPTPSTTPTPKIFKPSGSETASFGVVNAGNAKSKPEADTEKKNSTIKTILLLILIPLFLIAYTFVWIIIFGVDVMGLLSPK